MKHYTELVLSRFKQLNKLRPIERISGRLMTLSILRSESWQSWKMSQKVINISVFTAHLFSTNYAVSKTTLLTCSHYKGCFYHRLQLDSDCDIAKLTSILTSHFLDGSWTSKDDNKGMKNNYASHSRFFEKEPCRKWSRCYSTRNVDLQLIYRAIIKDTTDKYILATGLI